MPLPLLLIPIAAKALTAAKVYKTATIATKGTAALSKVVTSKAALAKATSAAVHTYGLAQTAAFAAVATLSVGAAVHLLDQVSALRGAIHKGDIKSIVSNAIKLKLNLNDHGGFDSLVSSLDNAIAMKEFSPACLEGTYRELENFQAALNNKLS